MTQTDSTVRIANRASAPGADSPSRPATQDEAREYIVSMTQALGRMAARIGEPELARRLLDAAAQAGVGGR